MRFHFSFLLVLFSGQLAVAQIYKTSSTIEHYLITDSTPYRNQIAAWDYSYIGDHYTALRVHDTIIDNTVGHRPEPVIGAIISARNELEGYHPSPALPFILDAAKNTRIVIINEAHHNASHRLFAASLLPGLSKLGYHFFGAEALSHNDSNLNSRKTVLLSSGSYTVEPCFANLLREAVDLGYQIFPYEAGPNDFGKYREIVQAENIKKVLDQHPDSKLFIYCGYDHAVEDSLSHDWLLAMAGRLKQITGIDPLTIDQVELSERIPASGENAYRHSMSASYSAVWVDKDGKVFNQANENKYYDLNIYHPNTELINGRPKWRYTSATRAVRCSGIDQFPTLVLAYRESEDITQAVPVDVVEIREKGANVPLLLPTGKYTVVYRAVDGTEKVWKKQVH